MDTRAIVCPTTADWPASCLIQVMLNGTVKTAKSSGFALLLTLGIVAQAGAELFNITFDLGQGDTGSGQIDVVTGTNGNSFAASGYLNISSGQAAGNWSLHATGGATNYPGFFTSPAGAYWYNNGFYPTGVNPQYPGLTIPLDNYGLLFTLSGGQELNLWGNADGSFTLHGSINGFQNFNTQIFSSGGPGVPVISFSPVPEPGAVLLTAIGGILFALQRMSMNQRRCLPGK